MDGDEEMRDSSDAGDCDASGGSGGGGGVGGEFEAEAEEVVVMEVKWFEVDWEYEFDAPRWFDLAREESPAEAAVSQRWFASAPSYPPSPLIARMLAEDFGLQSLRSISDLDVVHCSKYSHACTNGAEQRLYQSHVPNEGRRPHYGVSENVPKVGCRSTVKGTFSKGSTLMNPTASQLAKQNRQHEAKTAMRSKKPSAVKSERSSNDSKDCTYQATKRQRLERGHLNKAVGANQLELIHKAREKTIQTMIHPGWARDNGITKLKFTIPREPELETKRRAERSRIQRVGPTDAKQLNEGNRPSVSIVQGRTSNRKNISNELHIEKQELNRTTQNKAIQQSAGTAPQTNDYQRPSIQGDAVGSTVLGRTIYRSRQLQNVDKRAEECRDDLFKFKARPLDKKILSSKGDVGIFRSAKRNTTVPKEFNLSTSRRGQQTPLTELFNKLSLTSEARRGTGSRTSELPSYVTSKDCKENMIGNMQC